MSEQRSQTNSRRRASLLVFFFVVLRLSSKAAQGGEDGALYSQLWDRDLWPSLRVDRTLSSRTPPSTSYITGESSCLRE